MTTATGNGGTGGALRAHGRLPHRPEPFQAVAGRTTDQLLTEGLRPHSPNQAAISRMRADCSTPKGQRRSQ